MTLERSPMTIGTIGLQKQREIVRYCEVKVDSSRLRALSDITDWYLARAQVVDASANLRSFPDTDRINQLIAASSLAAAQTAELQASVHINQTRSSDPVYNSEYLGVEEKTSDLEIYLVNVYSKIDIVAEVLREARNSILDKSTLRG